MISGPSPVTCNQLSNILLKCHSPDPRIVDRYSLPFLLFVDRVDYRRRGDNDVANNTSWDELVGFPGINLSTWNLVIDGYSRVDR